MNTQQPLHLRLDGGRELQGVSHQHHLGRPVPQWDEHIKLAALSGLINHSAGEVEWVAKETEGGREGGGTLMWEGGCARVQVVMAVRNGAVERSSGGSMPKHTTKLSYAKSNKEFIEAFFYSPS